MFEKNSLKFIIRANDIQTHTPCISKCYTQLRMKRCKEKNEIFMFYLYPIFTLFNCSKKNMCFLNIEFKFLKKIYEIKQIDVNDADKIQETDLV